MITLNKPLFDESEYADRNVVKAVIQKGDDVLLINDLLIGGGIEGDETHKEALARESMEEGGVTISSPIYLNTVVEYRDELKKRYVIHGYKADFVSQTTPTTKQDDEVGADLRWLPVGDAIMLMDLNEDSIKRAGPAALPGDEYQMRLLHTQMTSFFLKRATNQ